MNKKGPNKFFQDGDVTTIFLERKGESSQSSCNEAKYGIQFRRKINVGFI